MNWYMNMKIGTKMIIGYLIVALIAGGVGLMGIINIRTMDAKGDQMYEKMTVPLGHMILVADSFQRLRGNIKDIMMAETPEEIADYEGRIVERNAEFATAMEEFGKTLMTEEGKKQVAAILADKEKYDAVSVKIIAFKKQGNMAAANELLRGEGNTLRTAIEANYRALKDAKVNLAHQVSLDNQATTDSATYTTIGLIIGAMAISLLLGWFISSSIKKPISQMLAASNRIADGDLDVQMAFNSKDEVGLLASAFSRMLDNVNEVMSNINAASEQVASGSRQVSDSSMSLSQGATEQASSIEELTASIEEIASQTRLNAENANQANHLAENTKVNAVEGNGQMSLMLKSMEEINDSSNSISKIIKVIDEIAFQTNILALNAAVEAARAGEHGKGFAVVAEEVRNLAARSANAAKETTDLIEGSIKKVGDGTRIANQTAQALVQIVNSIEKVTVLVNDIAVASNEQAQGVDQINQGISQIADVVQTTSATSEETAAASEELSSQAELLKQQVARFKLRRSSGYNMGGMLEDVNPQLLRMLEQMKGKGMNMGSRGDDDMPPAQIGGGAGAGKKIVLSNRDFGKY